MKDLNLKEGRLSNDCYSCEEMADSGATQEQLDTDHAGCHGWNHCSVECCGSRPHCGN